MITIRTMKQIATARTLHGFRSGGSFQSLPVVEQARIGLAQRQRQSHETRRQQLEAVWQQRKSITRI